MRPTNCVGFSPLKIESGIITVLPHNAESPYKDMFSLIGDQCCVMKNMNEDKFFYQLSIYNENYVEWGVGSLNKQNFIRDTILQVRIGDITKPARNTTPSPLNNGYAILNCMIPEDYRQLMQASANAVLASSPEGVPFPLELPEKTVVGNLDGEVVDIDSQGLASILLDKIKWLFSKITGTVEMPVKILDLTEKSSLLLASQIRLRPRGRPRKAQPGTIIYNSRTNTLEVRTDKGWKTL